MMVRRVTMSDMVNSAARVLVMIDFEDMEAREIVKGRGYAWNRSIGAWETDYLGREELAAEIKAMIDLGFLVTDGELNGAAGVLMFAGLIEVETPVVFRLRTAYPFESKETRRFVFTAGEVVDGYQYGTMVRKDFKVR